MTITGANRPGGVVTYVYCGHDYEATISGDYRIRVLRAGALAGSWELLARASFTTGSGRTHRKEVVLGIGGCWNRLEENARALQLVEELATEGHHIRFPRNKVDTYSARRAYRRGRQANTSRGE